MSVSRFCLSVAAVVALVIASPAMYAQGSDDCATATGVGEGTHAYDSTGSTPDGVNCDSNMSDDIWFSYTASCNGTATIGTCEGGTSGQDTVLSVWDGAACPSAGDTCLASNDDSCGSPAFASELSMAVTAGTSYLIQVGAWNGGAVAGDMDISLATSNDDCCGATAVGEGTHAYDTAGATVDGPADCDSNMGEDVWFSYTPSCSGTATIGTCEGGTSSQDTVLIAYDGATCPSAGDPCLASNDDSCGAPAFASELQMPVTGGQSYLIQVGAWNGGVVAGDLDITLTPGSNDDCCAATPVAEGTHAYDTTGATVDGPADCDSNMGEDVWFSYTASCDGTATIGTCEGGTSGQDTVLIVYDGAACPAAGDPCLASNDDSCGSPAFASELSMAVTAGNSYLIQVGAWNGGVVAGDLDISLASPAESNCADGIDDDCDGLTDCDDSDCAGSSDCSNDDCAGAYPVGEGTHAYDTTGSTVDGPNDCDSNMVDDVWFSYTPSANGTATIGTCEGGTSSQDTVLIVYDGAACPSAGDPCLASNDDSCGSPAFASELTLEVSAGNSYLIQVGAWNGGASAGDMDISLVACTNDDPCGATAVGEGTHAYDNSAATAGGPDDCDANMGEDVWFSYTASTSGTATIDTCEGGASAQDTVLIVYDGASAPAAGGGCLASNDDSCGSPAFASEVSMPVTAGNSYYVQIGSWNSGAVAGDLNISVTPPDACANAIEMFEGANAFDTTGFPGTGTAPTGCTSSYGQNSADGWYLYTSIAAANVTFDTCDTAGGDTDLAIYENDCGALTVIGCDGDSGAPSCQGFSSEVGPLTLAAGQTVLINIGEWSGGATGGPGTCNITVVPLAPEDCATPGDEDGNGLADCADPACAAEPDCQEAGNCGDNVDNDQDGATDCADADCAADTLCTGCPTSLSQSVDTATINGALACTYGAGAPNADNEYYRSWDTSIYDCPEGIRVTAVNVGIGLADDLGGGGAMEMTVRVYNDPNGGDPDAGMSLVSEETFAVTAADAGTMMNVPLTTPAALPSGATLVVGVFTPDGIAAGVQVRAGTNDLGETNPSWITAGPCGIFYAPLSNFGAFHVVMTLETDDLGAGVAGDECALAVNVNAGANAFDSTGMTDSPEANPGPGGCTNGAGWGNLSNDMWFSYTAATAGAVTVSTCDPAGIDTDMAVYNSCGGALIDCNGDAPADGACQSFHSVVDAGVMAAGDTIIIRVGAWSVGASGPGTLTITNIPPLPTINEIRIDQPSTDTDEYFELAGLPQDLTGLTYITLGDDSSGGSGTIEAVVDLTGQTMGGSGYWWAAEGSATLGTPDMVTAGNDLNFENSDNVTHMLVSDFTGAAGDDLDTDDDGVLDSEPWSAVVDSVALIETVGSGDLVYSATTVGPDGTFVPGHVERCPAPGGNWDIAAFDPADGTDTPGADNSCLTPPENDECADAIAVGVGATPMHNISATDSADVWDPSTCSDAQAGDMLSDVWFTFTSADSGTASVSTCDPTGWDTDISWSTGDCGALTQVACSGDADVTGGDNGGACQQWWSEMTGLTVTAGETYTIRVGSWGTGQGVGTLTISFVPAGDEPCDAIEVFDGTTIVDNNAANDGSLPTGADADSNCTGTFLGQFNQDMWYTYTATCDGTVSIDTCDENGFDTDLAIYEGDCATLDQPTYCSGDASTHPGPCQSFYSGLEFVATTGTKYLIRVGGWNDAAFGTTEMHIECAPDADPPTAAFTQSGYAALSLNFRPITLNDASSDGGDATATVDIDWGDGTPVETVAPGSSTPHVYAIDLTTKTGFEATPSVTITNIVGSDTVSGDTLRLIPIGDTNNDLSADIADAQYLLLYMYLGGPAMDCYQAGDLNGDEIADLADVIYALYYLFVPGSDIPVLPANPNCDI